MKVAFETALQLKEAIDSLFNEFPVALYYQLESIAPFPGFQNHNGVEMYYVWSGSGSYLVGDRIYQLQPGTLMLIRPFTPHKVLQTNTAQMIGRHVLVLKESFLVNERFVEEPNPLLLLQQNDCIFIHAQPAHQIRIETIYNTIREELNRKEPGFASIVKCLVKELYMLIYRIHNQANQQPIHLLHESLPTEITYLVQYIGSNFQDQITLEKLAEKVHMNPAYLTTLFCKHTGFTVGKFITQKRLHHAKKLLRESTHSISQIANDSGFCDASYFIKVFKRYENTTPEAFRKSCKPDSPII